ncbi:MAG: hypothetical protein AB201_01725 [Parcubacteria bacterium C7867-006]|nr:MAG: hypothetical protein AB201_01725 [Parcubacteria bacterium C7867-006]
MKKDIKTILLFVFSFGGLLFAGYIGGIKFFTETCAFNESCPYFLGYPACYYGFAMYLVLSVTSYLLITNRVLLAKGLRIVSGVSLLGILFAGYFTFKELPLLFTDGIKAYALGLPTCALGLIFYVLIFVLSMRIKE